MLELSARELDAEIGSCAKGLKDCDEREHYGSCIVGLEGFDHTFSVCRSRRFVKWTRKLDPVRKIVKNALFLAFLGLLDSAGGVYCAVDRVQSIGEKGPAHGA